MRCIVSLSITRDVCLLSFISLLFCYSPSFGFIIFLFRLLFLPCSRRPFPFRLLARSYSADSSVYEEGLGAI